MREKGTSTISTTQTARTVRFRFAIAAAPSEPTMFCVCPEGKEYPVAAARADSTMVKFGSSTHGRGMRKYSLHHWLHAMPPSPAAKM